ncbi:MAG: glycosyltransferase [Lachnospiraceae bacterium]|nr:glycosyltransferase [Lachnospiraceae bacterium]
MSEKYDFKIDINEKDSHTIILKQIKAGSTVLEFGPANGNMTRYMKEVLDCDVYIVEIDKQSFNKALKYAKDGIHCDVEELLWAKEFKDIEFDYIIFADVLEHLKNPEQVLQNANRLLKNDGRVILSVPNVAHSGILAELYTNKFHYRQIGLLDNTHIHFFSFFSLCEMIESCDYIIEIYDATYNLLGTSEFKEYDYLLPENTINIIKAKRLGTVYQFIFTIVKKQYFIDNDIIIQKNIGDIPENITKIYLDYGNGFSEENIEIIKGNFTGEKIVFKVPDGVANIRVDLIEGKNCIVKELKVYCNSTMFNKYTINGEKTGEDFIFINEYPQIIIPEVKDISDITIKYDYIELNKNFLEIYNNCDCIWSEKNKMANDEITSLLSTLQDMKYKLNNQEVLIAKQSEEIINQKEEIENKDKELRNQKEEIENKDKELRNQKEEIENKDKELQNQKEKIENKDKELQGQKEEIENNNVVIDELTLSIKQNDLVIDKLNNEIERFKLEYANKMMINEELFAKLQNAEIAYVAIKNSTHWRLTYPLRVSADTIKELFNRTKYTRLIKKGVGSIIHNGPEITFKKTKKYLFEKKVNEINLYTSITESLTETDDEDISILDLCSKYNYEVFGATKIDFAHNNKSKTVILVSHELTITGAPIVLFYFARILKNIGYLPIILSPVDGLLKEEINKEGIPLIIADTLASSTFLEEIQQKISFIVACTIVTYYVINKLANMDIPVLWWIHEAIYSYEKGGFLAVMPNELPQNVNVVCGGNYAKHVLKRFFPNYKADTLLYYLPDILNDYTKNKNDIVNLRDKFVFAIIGSFEERKAQDIFVRAIETMDNRIRKSCYFLFIGKPFDENINKSVEKVLGKYLNNSKHIEQVSRDDLFKLYAQIDCLVCTSKDDPMPVVVTEAMALSKSIICSENTGSASIISKFNAGLIYRENSVTELVNCMEKIAENYNNNEMAIMRDNARYAYEQMFSYNAFMVNVNDTIDKLLHKTDNLHFDVVVSVIFPVYNPQKDFEFTVDLLHRQKGIKAVEVILVDSESENIDSAEVFKKSNKLIHITQKQFSHSFARNLGGENASGDILIFMTQDAMPTDEYWVAKIIAPIMNEGIAAVSCMETCPDGTDLYYRVASKTHSNFVLDGQVDRIGFYSRDMTPLVQRKNASLNDVSTAIKADIWRKYKYRFSFAEDLDLGLRLIKDDNKVKIMSSVTIVHGHNRNAGYYLKRSIAEGFAMDKIIGKTNNCEQDKNIFSQINTVFIALNYIFEDIKENISKSNVTEYCEELVTLLDEYINKKNVSDLLMKEYDDKIINDFYNSIVKIQENLGIDTAVISHLKNYAKENLLTYVIKEYSAIDENLKSSIRDSLLKQACAYCGILSSKISDAEMIDKVKLFAKGV